ncbi:hypothetical protein ACUNV4_12295 [Granulosicoccus sp. 3-233]|uniref:hypothetical protein n=1 Tax=Granulosicoccus sp. 3-233 TaxID=3417969 RepID=UPI003D32F12E
MQWLTAIIAFATTMLIFAVIVSTFVELIHRVFRMRGKGMQLMLENLYTRAIEPHLDSRQAQTMNPGRFAEIIMENRAIAYPADTSRQGRMGTLLGWLVDSRSMTDIPVEVFTQKLADSRIVGAAEHFTDDVLQDIAQKYEAFGHEVGTYFGRRARVFSVGVAFVVVWLFYVHPYEIAVTYFSNPAIAQSVADKAVDSQNEYAELKQQLQGITEGGNMTDAQTSQLSDAFDALRQEMAATRVTTRELAASGIPLGWPDAEAGIAVCFSEQTGEGSTGSSASAVDRVSGFCRYSLPLIGVITIPSFANSLWLIVGGLLVGLGAPFWAQAVSSLTATRDLTRRIARTVSAGVEEPSSRSRGGGVPRALNEAPVHVRTFNVSRASREKAE